ncbi:MAG: YkgJ family cysteine cluster protein [Spirochaetes bacterium]|nr:YkgJ family cysteine cluster protein [Spirochaetota bacterium]
MSTYCIECAKKGDDCCRSDFSKFLTLKDAERIAEFLGEDMGSFAVYRDVRDKDKELEAYQTMDPGYYYSLMRADGRLLQIKNKSNGACLFHDECGWCRIYPARPLICRTYPFWYTQAGDVMFDGSSKDCQIVKALAGSGDPEAVVRIENRDESLMRCALQYIGHDDGTMKSLLLQMRKELDDYRGRISRFIDENEIAGE